MTIGKVKYEKTIPNLDEGWWESVLAEENRYSPATQRMGQTRLEVQKEAENESAEEQVTVNWSQIKELYLNDRIVDLKVTGHNRGGLLVEGNGLFGFVPFSHLIELAGHENPDRAHDLEPYLGRTLRLKVIECVPEDGRVVFSERAAQSELLAACRERRPVPSTR